MLLDAVLADRRYGWLGTEQDKRTYFREALDSDLPDDWYPHLTFGDGRREDDAVLSGQAADWRAAQRASGGTCSSTWRRARCPPTFGCSCCGTPTCSSAVHEWTIRVLLPRRFRKAAALYRYAVRDAFMMPLKPARRERARLVLSRASRRGGLPVAGPRSGPHDGRSKVRRGTVRGAVSRVAAARRSTPSARCRCPTLREQLQRGEGRIEFAELPHQYLQLTPLVGSVHAVESGLHEGDNLVTA